MDVLADSPVAVLYEPVPDVERDENQSTGAAGYMTLALGIHAEDAIVLMADGRVSRKEYGTVVVMSDERQKVHGFGRFGVALAGFHGIVDAALADLRTHEEALNAAPTARESERLVANVLRDIDRESRERGAQPAPPGSVLLAGYAKDGSRPRIGLFSTETGYYAAESRWAGNRVAGIGAEAFTAFVSPDFPDDQPRPSVESAKLLGAVAILAASRIDQTVGPLFTVATIDAMHGFRDCSDEVPGLIAHAARTRERVRGLFTTPGA